MRVAASKGYGRYVNMKRMLVLLLALLLCGVALAECCKYLDG